MSQDDSKIFIRLDLEGEIKTCFEALKKKKGVRNNTELVRLLIIQEYDRVFGAQGLRSI